MTEPSLRPAFKKGLELIGEASRRLQACGIAAPILVGGAAAELFSAGAISTGDFDLVTDWQTEVEDALLALGFERPHDRTRGLQHYAANVGVEIVARELLDGAGEPERCTKIELSNGRFVILIGVEDLIADRVAQYQSHPPGMRSRLDQAILLYRSLETRLDAEYLNRQMGYQAPGLNLSWLKEQVDADGQTRNVVPGDFRP